MGNSVVGFWIIFNEISWVVIKVVLCVELYDIDIKLIMIGVDNWFVWYFFYIFRVVSVNKMFEF